ncbi:MAG: RNA polymerase sigma factor [bacterium (Candidatus Stahlbacteria) CG08_land_8_20_14_0_20_40_26]|nr:MAG: RNA polymerase sigma factor [bacterium (Candidatus Stahlbacteria) CG08_land_8_20_14_0_20_40_26]
MKKTHNSEDPDAKMIKKVAEGDEVAFEQIVRKYEHRVLNTIYRYIGKSDEAEDIAQEVFIKVWHHAKSFKGKSKFSTWLYRIVVNQCLNYRSKHKERLASLDEIMEQGKTPESLKVEIEFERQRKSKIMKRAIDDLSKRQRIALVLSKFEGKSYKEIAQIMGISLSAVESLIFRARGALKKKLLPLIKKGEI